MYIMMYINYIGNTIQKRKRERLKKIGKGDNTHESMNYITITIALFVRAIHVIFIANTNYTMKK